MVNAAVPRVMIVEDDPGIAFLERETFERAGFEVKEFALGQPALECIARCESPALLVLDYLLPDMTGAYIVTDLGDRIPALPVVMVTGYPDPAVAEQVRAAGVRDYISKDVDLKFLDQMLEAAQAAIASDPEPPS
ncbi:MAG: response regulator [Actinomycetia bacterium]|nr:response regulator [Actinomycetes bacterium]